jgi:phosphatidylserine/phosphatidylglycerophosphate/cardiolipin synthase-like enzyme
MPYEPVVSRKSGPVRGTALVGINSVLLGFDFLGSAAERRNLLGFAIHREDVTRGEASWLVSQLRFRSQARDYGEDIPSNLAPFQKYHWGDYTARPNNRYRYKVYAVSGSADAPDLGDPVVLEVTTTTNAADRIGVYFNRGVTATRAYRIRFGDVEPDDVPDGAAYWWLSRGLQEALLAFVEKAADGDTLKVSIYEFEHESMIQALKAAKARGVQIAIVYHATGDAQTRENKASVKELNLAARRVSPRTEISISHNKFIVHSRNGSPERVWTGSTNWTENGFFRQTNVGILLQDPGIAGAFDAYFDLLAEDLEATSMKPRLASLVTSLNAGFKPEQRLFFSPVKDTDQLDLACDMVAGAESAVFLSSPFGLAKPISDALNANEKQVLEYGLVNVTQHGALVKALDRSINTTFSAPAYLREYDGRAWDPRVFGQGHKIHVKSMIVDPWGKKPRILIGSANFSLPSVHKNDENAFYFEGEGRLAAIATSEFLRMFDHYKFRHFVKRTKTKPQARYLDESGNWNQPYFNRKHPKYRDREVFVGS